MPPTFAAASTTTSGRVTGEPGLHRAGVAQIELIAAGREQVGVALRLQGAQDGAAGHAAMARHEDPIRWRDQGHRISLIRG